jgi:hypothetical protein
MTYNNRTMSLLLDSKGELILPRVPKPRSESMKCQNCAYSTPRALKHPNVICTMQRLYVRTKSTWNPIGWYCQNCGSVVLDDLTKKKILLHYSRPKDSNHENKEHLDVQKCIRFHKS